MATMDELFWESEGSMSDNESDESSDVEYLAFFVNFSQGTGCQFG